MNREELAWAAGFYDGEGTMGCPIINVRWRALKISIHQVHRGTLERFQRAVGGLGYILAEKAPSRTVGNRKPIFKWESNKFEHVQAVVAMLWPWLSRPKREQAASALRSMRAYHTTLQERRKQCA